MALAHTNMKKASAAAETYEIYSELTRDSVYGALMQAGSEEQVAGIIGAVVNRGELDTVTNLDSIVAVLNQHRGSQAKLAVCQALQAAGPAAKAYAQTAQMLLKDGDADVKYNACLTIATIGAPCQGSSDALKELLGDQVEQVRTAACTALGAIGDKQQAQALKNMLNDQSPEVQGAACMALAHLGEAGAASDIAKKLDASRSRMAAVSALGIMGDGASKHAVDVAKCLGDEDNETRIAAVTAIGQLAEAVRADSAALDVVKDFLKDENGARRCAAAMALYAMGANADDCVDDIKELLTDDFSSPVADALTIGGVRSRLPSVARKPKCAAAMALGAMGPKGAELADDVSRLLNDENWEVRLAACEALGAMGEMARDQAIKVAALFEDDTFMVRARAANACGKLGDADVATGLADMLPDTCPTVREEALLSLGELGDEGQEHIEKVFEKLQDDSPQVRAAACKTLGKMGEKGQLYAAAVAQLLVSDVPVVRLAAIEALGAMEDHGGAYAEEIAENLQDPLPQIRMEAAKALGNLGADAAEFSSQIRALCDDPSADTAKAAEQALVALSNHSKAEGE